MPWRMSSAVAVRRLCDLLERTGDRLGKDVGTCLGLEPTYVCGCLRGHSGPKQERWASIRAETWKKGFQADAVVRLGAELALAHCLVSGNVGHGFCQCY